MLFIPGHRGRFVLYSGFANALVIALTIVIPFTQVLQV